jgi:DNA-binding beta-propeller fold protein YncE
VLTLRETVELPRHPPGGGFDHGDVHLGTGRVFVAHTALGTVDVIDGERAVLRGTIRGCPEASGVLCAQNAGLVFAAARGAGTVLIIDAMTETITSTVRVGPKPNGLAWAPRSRRLLVADVQDFRARLVDPERVSVVASTELPGRPRWCIYDEQRNRFLVNIREPACITILDRLSLAYVARWPVSSAGPHGLDLDAGHDRAFVACDGGKVIALDLAAGRELAAVAIPGEPDAIWYNEDRERLYVAIGRPGLITVIDTREMSVAEEVATEAGAHTTAFDRRRQMLYVFLPGSCRAGLYKEQ